MMTSEITFRLLLILSIILCKSRKWKKEDNNSERVWWIDGWMKWRIDGKMDGQEWTRDSTSNQAKGKQANASSSSLSSSYVSLHKIFYKRNKLCLCMHLWLFRFGRRRFVLKEKETREWYNITMKKMFCYYCGNNL